MDDGVYTGIGATMEIPETEGQTFVAEITWTTPDGEMSDEFVGAMTQGGNLIYGSKATGVYSLSAVEEDTLDFCYTETGDEYLVACGQFTRDE